MTPKPTTTREQHAEVLRKLIGGDPDAQNRALVFALEAIRENERLREDLRLMRDMEWPISPAEARLRARVEELEADLALLAEARESGALVRCAEINEACSASAIEPETLLADAATLRRLARGSA